MRIKTLVPSIKNNIENVNKSLVRSVLIGLILMFIILIFFNQSTSTLLVTSYVSQGMDPVTAQQIVDYEGRVLGSTTVDGIQDEPVDLQPLNNFDFIRPSTVLQHKLGYNQGDLVGALAGSESDKFWQMARDTGAGWVLGIAYGPADLSASAGFIRRAHENGMRPFLRFCWVDNCGWSVSGDVEEAAEDMCEFLTDLHDTVGMSYTVSVGPNEPAAEMTAWGFAQNDFGKLTQYVKLVHECVRRDRDLSKDYSGIKMAPVIFNIGNAETPEKALMEAQGLFDHEYEGCFPWDVYAINTYNTGPIGDFWTRAYKFYYDNLYETAQECGVPIVVSETGNFDASSPWTDLTSVYNNEGLDRYRNYFLPLLEEIRKMQSDPMIIGIMMFRTIPIQDGELQRVFPNKTAELNSADIFEPSHITTELEKRILFDASKNNEYPICSFSERYENVSYTSSTCGISEIESSKNSSTVELKLNCSGSGAGLNCNSQGESAFKIRAPIENIIGNYGSISNQHLSPCDISRSMLEKAEVKSLNNKTVITSGSVRVMKVGDSISFHPNHMPLDEFRELGVEEIINAAKNGSGTASYMATSGTYPSDPALRNTFVNALDAKPDVSVVMLGTNDCGAGEGFLAEYESNLASIVREIKDAGSKVLMVAFPERRSSPRPSADCGGTNPAQTESQYRDAFVRVANSTGSTLLRADQVVSEGDLDPDGLHLSNYTGLNQAIKEALADMIGATTGDDVSNALDLSGQEVAIDHSVPFAGKIRVGGYEYPLPGWDKALDCAMIIGRTNNDHDPHLQIELTPGAYLGFATAYKSSGTVEKVPTLGYGTSPNLETFTITSSITDQRLTLQKEKHEEVILKIAGSDPLTKFYYDPEKAYKPDNACADVNEVVYNEENMIEGPMRIMPDSRISMSWPTDGHVCWDNIHRDDPLVYPIIGDKLNDRQEEDSVGVQCVWVGFRSGCSTITATCARRHPTCPFNSYSDYRANSGANWATNVDLSTCYEHRGSEEDVKARYMRSMHPVGKKIAGDIEIGGVKDILANLFTEAQRRLKVSEGDLRSLLIDAEKDVPIFVEQYTYDLNETQTSITGGFNMEYETEFCKIPSGRDSYFLGENPLASGAHTIEYVSYMKDLNTITVLLDILTNVLPTSASVDLPTIKNPVPTKDELEGYVSRVVYGARDRRYPKTSFPVVDSNSPILAGKLSSQGGTPYDHSPAIIGWCDQNQFNGVVQRLFETPEGIFRYGTWNNDLVSDQMCTPVEACYPAIGGTIDPTDPVDPIYGDGVCPLTNGICTQGPNGPFSHASANMNAVDLSGGNLVAPTDGEVLLSLTGNDFTRCGSGRPAGGAVWFKAYYLDESGNEQEQILFFYHVYVPSKNSLEGSYRKGEVITRLSTENDSDHAPYMRFDSAGNITNGSVAACSSGPHVHLELASGASGSKSELNQRGPVNQILASWGCRMPDTPASSNCGPGDSILGVSTSRGRVLAEQTCKETDINLYPVGREREIPGCVEPSNLVQVNTDRPYFKDTSTAQSTSDFRLIPEAASALERMMNDMRSQNPTAYQSCGFNWGYRSADLQRSFGECGSRSTACACHSEHQLGTTFDFRPSDGRGVGSFQSTACYSWVTSNASRYGFVQSYTAGNPDYSTEPWHWRWLPGSHASDFLNSSNSYLIDYLENLCEFDEEDSDTRSDQGNNQTIDPNLPDYCKAILEDSDDDDDPDSGCNEWNCGLPGNQSFKESLSCAAGISYYHNSTDVWIDRYGPFCDTETNFAGFPPKDEDGNGQYESIMPYGYNFFKGCYDVLYAPGSAAGRSCAELPPNEARPQDVDMDCPGYGTRKDMPEYEYYRGALKRCSISIDQTYWTAENTFGFENDPAGLAQELINRNINYFGSSLSDAPKNKIVEVLERAKANDINPGILLCNWATETHFGRYCPD